MPNLLAATKEYWRKLDELEAAYHRDEVSVEEVDARVKELMRELGQARREMIAYILSGLSHFWREQKETIIGTAMLGVAVCGWAIAG
ncbi:MAG: hypothetical protein BRC40_14095 [Cyanobacteria bacterium QH_8_48_120]|jgi:hypothetical protein|nr:MAG: hypothetical protein BRC34_15250 [Cyanobacteria bacterium QH_1_48_107]PSO56276.1 MAG: hypothetical protein BRC35_09515 [Cyanobacteria bacterium QH_10_48_56]PSO56828.1 MAG: hypothetical protein BRC39_16475 [Cyanobacteria bacterium QH_7_48_89]PSO62388.1 MAG: hypothetical protein BRC36_10075 [Cyanobacteria bacterium QH_2_48_84]PSO64094.1 MAG: hypothetical protein BRC38_12310 [Cyanobacteria bacterium QH_6_48_35]PSO68024.1 MAG: hypothetical protein BRC42_14640 [Cyanobacteria bacterium QS_1_